MSPGDDLDVCTTRSDLEANDGDRAAVVGTYEQVDLSKIPDRTAYVGHVGVKLSDSTVHLGPTWSDEAKRDSEEIERFEGRTVQAVGLLHAEMPRPPTERFFFTGPCLHPVERVEHGE